MDLIVVLLIAVIYWAIGIVIAGTVDSNAPHIVIVLFWPVVLVTLAVAVILISLWGIVTALVNLGGNLEWLKKRK